MKKILMGLLLMLCMMNNAFANKLHGVIRPYDYIMLPISSFNPKDPESLRHPFPIKHYKYVFIVHSYEKNTPYQTIFILGRLDLISYKESTGDFIYKFSLSNDALSTGITSTKEYIPKHSKFTLDDSKKNYVIVKGRYNKKSDTAIPTNNSLINITTIIGGAVIMHAARDIPFTIIYD